MAVIRFRMPFFLKTKYIWIYRERHFCLMICIPLNSSIRHSLKKISLSFSSRNFIVAILNCRTYVLCDELRSSLFRNKTICKSLYQENFKVTKANMTSCDLSCSVNFQESLLVMLVFSLNN